MLVACRLAGLSALKTYYAGVSVGAQMRGGCSAPSGPSGQWRISDPPGADRVCDDRASRSHRKRVRWR